MQRTGEKSIENGSNRRYSYRNFCYSRQIESKDSDGEEAKQTKSRVVKQKQRTLEKDPLLFENTGK